MESQGVPCEVQVDSARPEEKIYMRLCVELAQTAAGHTSPNPLVGCVIVKDGEIVGQGFHPRAGEPHAEVFALKQAGPKAKGATAYVSLEPCNHVGRTPPCSQALVRAGVKRVVVGMVDPNPQVAGKGVKTLEKSKIEVVVGVEEELCRRTNEIFVHNMLTGKPYVALRYCLSLDGAFLGKAPTASKESGSYYSRLLQKYDAVVLTDAAIYDDPFVLSSEPGAKQPLRVVLARSMDLPLDSQVFDTSVAPTIVVIDADSLVADVQSTNRHAGQTTESLLTSKGVTVVALQSLELDAVLDILYRKGACSVLLDSRGPDLSGLENFLGVQAITEEVPQKLIVAISPQLAGENAIRPSFPVTDELSKLERLNTEVVGDVVVIEGYFPRK
eukprot:TRINITY_DN2980_c0_g1_i3.p1 TRINITY_DN2980_c0_g1~~TRINITY_DN2980_c0_g1_i3.p1  ORF type:complete len:386 (+),score=54.52 TRINITY_DN2980_c0_g1_i3:183-1340(+)